MLLSHCGASPWLRPIAQDGTLWRFPAEAPFLRTGKPVLVPGRCAPALHVCRATPSSSKFNPLGMTAGEREAIEQSGLLASVSWVDELMPGADKVAMLKRDPRYAVARAASLVLLQSQLSTAWRLAAWRASVEKAQLLAWTAWLSRCQRLRT